MGSNIQGGFMSQFIALLERYHEQLEQEIEGQVFHFALPITLLFISRYNTAY